MPKITTQEQAAKALIKHMEYTAKAERAMHRGDVEDYWKKAGSAAFWQEKADKRMLEVLQFLGVRRAELISLGLTK